MRRKIKIKHTLGTDPVYNSKEIEKFTNYLLWEGKKSIARQIVYKTFEEIKNKTKSDPVAVFQKAIDNVSPWIQVRSKRVGGATYQVPKEIPTEKRISLAMRWIIVAARAKKGKNIASRLSEELILASKNEGTAVKKREDTHRMAEANRAFAHFAW
ncbi:MAG: 30S ribosomal protein S7 [Candidatus Tagabacteria bacterium CG_4_10_14_0_2_um_filter_40_13]|uniref:Small ribosomal subunit protein uS7 n=2 Tax=Candidatus Tagaibacteriota TaxID=1817918 RepID=A0A2M7B8W8_9BACT|nr:MAG: 30S ribosomal protein S7 [Candidatus Tagabacteria bacterium CG11_big_fil_rev_8_21_14_0_20_41_11]PIU99556.1 MAG: 30S ribosomal protein S7 [Candidatus Tagabacteria bacterium CG03_land_8_20_14_0_80_41_22]PIZ56124.1 MAG: 30S ribosomal protein S7 [Candidatus Tagabacteria bacterium CG_4_10_14_0_2_um_filter_40_13]PJC24992.1 MAG: 30S ribosomal protein S7 [Candidatus Tagabacteria bacterium CG_4_9_14_0_2_um_filter_41_11]